MPHRVVVARNESDNILLGIVDLNTVPLQKVQKQHAQVGAFQRNFLVGLDRDSTFS